jgi:site-specific DNA recombinase
MPTTSSKGHSPKKRVVLYARVSTDEQAKEGYSLAQQLEALREYAARERYEVQEEVLDPGQSGASLERPGLDRVRDLVAEGSVFVVLAQDRDRFSREPAYSYLLKREFEEHGCKLRALNDRGDDSPEGELMDGVFDQFAKFERAKTAERTRRGRLRKAREGKVPGNGTPDYGFRFNEGRDGYEINPNTMPIVGRIFHMIGEERASIHGVVDTFNQEGSPAPNGGRWNRAFVRKAILDDVYRSHSYSEIAALVSPEVAGRLDPKKRYGILWYNKVKRQNRQVSERGFDGKRAYRTKSTSTPKPRKEWIAVPVPDPGIPRELVDAAREAIKDNKKSSSSGSRFWELSGGIARCAECGRALTPQTAKRKRRGTVDYYYRCLGHGHEGTCSNKKHYRAEDLEGRVAQEVVSLFRDRRRLLSRVDERIEIESQREPEQEAEVWTNRIKKLDEKLSRAQDLAIDGLISKEDLHKKTVQIELNKETAERELEALKDEQKRLQELRWARALMLHLYTRGLMANFDHISPHERHDIYKKLKLRVRVHPEGTLEVEGSVDANMLPTDIETAKPRFVLVRNETPKNGERRHKKLRLVPASSTSEMSTTRRFR